MVAENLRKELSQRFRLICFVDLADLRRSHRAIFDLFRSNRQDQFLDNQRLVLYSAHDPEQDFLNHIQRAASRIDISNYFILIVCPHDLRKKLEHANEKFGYDNSVIQSLIAPIADTGIFDESRFYKTDYLCPLPFTQVSVSPTQEVQPCCRFQGSIGNLRYQSLTEIFSGNRINDVRNQMRSGGKPKECSVCWHEESAGTTSYRQLAMIKYGDLDQGWVDDVQLRYLTWEPASLCNFACRICCAESSSKIAAEQIKFSQDTFQRKYLNDLIKKSNNRQSNVRFIQSLGEFGHLDFLHILGGEPFVWPHLADLIDWLIGQNLSKKLTIAFNTNCSIYPEQHIKSIVQKFKAIEIQLSVDNVGARFEIERGGKWSEILENIQKFSLLRSANVKIHINAAINLQNVLYLDDVIDLAEQLGITVQWWYVEDPEFLCIDYANEDTKKIVANKYLHHRDHELRRMASRILNSKGSDGKKFLEYINTVDSRRKQSFWRTHPEIYRSMGGCV